MKFKKIYIEITNVCNLNCSFCAKTNRTPKYMNLDEFEIILNKIKNYTEYIYLHVLGEPLLHPKINEFINLAAKLGFKVNITTNGYLINNIKNNQNIRQINISLHSYNKNNNLTLDEYLNNIFEATKHLKNNTYINYRLWVNNQDTEIILKKLNDKYNKNITLNDRTLILDDNIFFSSEKEFIWPSKVIEEGSNYSLGTCRALKDHIAILVDGTIVPCCLDNNANINLGNIFNHDLDEIITSSTYKDILMGFNNNKKINKLCQNCNFYSLK